MTNVIEWHSVVGHQISEPEDAAQFVHTLGFCTWGPVPGFDFPNLAEAMGHTATSVLGPTWTWKDDLHFARQLYYGKIIAGQPSFLSPDYLPAFIAALGPEEERDPFHLYHNGHLSREAKTIYEYLSDNPAQPTRALRIGTKLQGKSAKTLMERALLELQRRFLVCKVDLTGRTRGTYSYVWDLAERFWPEAFVSAGSIEAPTARERIRGQLEQVDIRLTPAQERRLFLWG